MQRATYRSSLSTRGTDLGEFTAPRLIRLTPLVRVRRGEEALLVNISVADNGTIGYVNVTVNNT